MTHHTQCRLKRGDVVLVSWIPKEFAKKGKYLKLKNEGQWTDGWKVLEVWSTRTTEHVMKHRDDYKQQRKASDI